MLEVFDSLANHYLSTRVPLLAAALQALGVIVREEVKTTIPDGRAFDYLRTRIPLEPSDSTSSSILSGGRVMFMVGVLIPRQITPKDSIMRQLSKASLTLLRRPGWR